MLFKSNACGWLKSLVAATLLFFPASALADNYDGQESSGSTRIQIKRPEALKARALVEHDLGAINDDEAAKLRSIFAEQAQGPRPGVFKGNAAQSDSGFHAQSPMLDRLFKANANANQPGLMGRAQQAPDPDNAPYVWCQSVNGGYYDATGTYKTVVPGYRLRELGGRFNDGTPVPRGAVKMNEAGHVWWQNDLSPSFKRYGR